MNTTTKLAAIQIDLDMDITRTRADLAKAARYLADDMVRLAESIENDATAKPNALGEIQGRGLKVDLLCAKLDELRKMQARLTYLAAE